MEPVTASAFKIFQCSLEPVPGFVGVLAGCALLVALLAVILLSESVH
jgi:hypothetical protein